MDAERPVTILVVDDEPGVLSLVRRCLADRPVTLLEASGGVSALATIAERRTLDLLITDMRMPEMDGDELVRRVRTLEPDLKVLYLTGHADRLFDAQPQLWASEAYLDKPFTPGALREAIALLLFGHTTLQRMSGDE